MLQINNLQDTISFCEAQGLAKCFQAYADQCAGETILDIGFNPNSGYTYIALEHSSVTIASMLGRDVEYIVYDFETGEETFFNSYEEAVSSIK
jgi:hypothetical protein